MHTDSKKLGKSADYFGIVGVSGSGVTPAGTGGAIIKRILPTQYTKSPIKILPSVALPIETNICRAKWSERDLLSGNVARSCQTAEIDSRSRFRGDISSVAGSVARSGSEIGKFSRSRTASIADRYLRRTVGCRSLFKTTSKEQLTVLGKYACHFPSSSTISYRSKGDVRVNRYRQVSPELYRSLAGRA